MPDLSLSSCKGGHPISKKQSLFIVKTFLFFLFASLFTAQLNTSPLTYQIPGADLIHSPVFSGYHPHLDCIFPDTVIGPLNALSANLAIRCTVFLMEKVQRHANMLSP